MSIGGPHEVLPPHAAIASACRGQRAGTISGEQLWEAGRRR